jgi:hypothetical protein
LAEVAVASRAFDLWFHLHPEDMDIEETKGGVVRVPPTDQDLRDIADMITQVINHRPDLDTFERALFAVTVTCLRRIATGLDRPADLL